MNIISGFVFGLIACIFVVLLTLAGITRVNSWLIERRNPPVGNFATVGDTRIHYVHVPAPEGADLPPVVFIHGASANLLDQMVPLQPQLEKRAELLFFDRPGFGWSERGTGNETPTGQARTILGLMDQLRIQRAIVVGHSFGGGTAAALALAAPERVAGLVFVASATHPWPGGATSWYYDLASRPILGRLFSHTVAGPAATFLIGGATQCVFAPNPVPDGYLKRAGIELLLRPGAFRSNAIDVKGLFDHVSVAAPRYPEIKTPTVVITGDRDTVVYEELHSAGLARDIAGAEIVWVKNLGHKPDWIAPDLVAAAIARVAGKGDDLQTIARRVEARIAQDRSGEGVCVDEKVPMGALATE